MLAECERDPGELEGAKVDPDGFALGSTEGRDLIEQARVRPDPPALDRRADPRERDRIGRVLAGQSQQCQAERDRQRR